MVTARASRDKASHLVVRGFVIPALKRDRADKQRNVLRRSYLEQDEKLLNEWLNHRAVTAVSFVGYGNYDRGSIAVGLLRPRARYSYFRELRLWFPVGLSGG